MRLRSFALLIAGSIVGVLFYFGARIAQAQTSGGSLLAGSVSSQEEGLMEGVLVGAKKEGSPITVSVMSDDKGRYSFTQGRLQAGRYSLRIRAVGYDLQNHGPVEFTVVNRTQLIL